MKSSFFEIKKQCKVLCAKINVWSIIVKECTNTLIFYIFECGVECSAQSGAKYYFIFSIISD